MSLFQSREWWSVKLGEQEEFSEHSMAIGNVDNDPGGGIKIVTGGLKGILRVHYPRQPNFRIEDLLLEQDLGAPILQVAIGQFIPSAAGFKSIAVLHPRKLAVFIVEAMGGKGEKASYFNLVSAYEHPLGIEGGHFTAYNMTYGGFGGVSRDLLCVQSMDGRLQVLEQDAHAFTRRLSKILIPGPICYVAKIDAFVLGNSELGIDCYKYQALAAIQSDQQAGEEGAEGISAVRGLQAYWSCRLGEQALDIFVAKFSRSLGPGQVDIVVLGERTLFTLREQGTVRLQKMLEYQPISICKYVVVAAPGEDASRLRGMTVRENDEGFASVVEEENLIIATDTGHVMVYKNLQLVWQAAVSRTPVAMAVGNFGGLPGLVCSLDEEGALALLYQGTDPPTSTVAPDRKEVDYEQINEEHHKLLQVIRRSQTESAGLPGGKLSLQVQVPRLLDDSGEPSEACPLGQAEASRERRPGPGDDPQQPSLTQGGIPKPAIKVTARFLVTYSGANEIRNANLSILPPVGVEADPTSVLLPSFGSTRGACVETAGSPTDPLVVEVVFRAERGSGRLPSSLIARASLVCTRMGEGGVESASGSIFAQCDVQLPFALGAGVVEGCGTDGRGVTGAAHEFVLSTSKASVSLYRLFEDMMPRVEDGQDGNVDYASPAKSCREVGGEKIGDEEDSGSYDSVLSFRYWATDPNVEAAEDVTVAASHTSGQYRIRSAAFAALSLAATELVRRVKGYFGEGIGQHDDRGRKGGREAKPRRDKNDCRARIDYAGSIPLQELYGIVDEHFSRRLDLQRASGRLDRAAQQYRVIEKRLLARFKDRHPSSLNKLEMLSEATYDKLSRLADDLQQAREGLGACAAKLACAARFVVLLLQHRCQLGSKDHDVLLAHFHPDLISTEDQGWEEVVDAAMVHLLRTVLAKAAKDSVRGLSAPFQSRLEMPPDTSKLKKHISIVCDRISKGGLPLCRPAAAASSPPGTPSSQLSPTLPALQHQYRNTPC